MTKNTVIDFTKPSDLSPDPLTDVLRIGAPELLTSAVLPEVAKFLVSHAHILNDKRHQWLVGQESFLELEVLKKIAKGSV